MGDISIGRPVPLEIGARSEWGGIRDRWRMMVSQGWGRGVKRAAGGSFAIDGQLVGRMAGEQIGFTFFILIPSGAPHFRCNLRENFWSLVGL